MAGVVQECCDPCQQLRALAAKLKRFAEVDAKAAAAAYQPFDPRKDAPQPQPRVPPPGYRNATDKDLEYLGLTRDFIDNPEDPDPPGGKTDFRAAVFVSDTGETLVAFKGTTTLKEMVETNKDQAFGKDTFYYTRAQEIAARIKRSPAGGNVRFTGHSLGGGLAAAAAKATGEDATTFNAAGLHDSTVQEPTPGSVIESVHVRGEVLTSVQDAVPLPKAASTQDYPLDPPRGFGTDVLAVLASLLGPKGAAAAWLLRAGMLHRMGVVEAALARAREDLDDELVRNGC